MQPTIYFKQLDKRAIVPVYQSPGASGFDFHALDGGQILPGEIVLFETGLACEIPIGLELQVRPRSGLAVKHGITVVNAPGTVDSDYRGPIMVGLINLGRTHHMVRAGDRIAQGVIQEVKIPHILVVEHLSETERGSGGFGSTGR